MGEVCGWVGLPCVLPLAGCTHGHRRATRQEHDTDRSGALDQAEFKICLGATGLGLSRGVEYGRRRAHVAVRVEARCRVSGGQLAKHDLCIESLERDRDLDGDDH